MAATTQTSPAHWVDVTTSLARWRRRLVLEDEIVDAQDCGDEARERRCLEELERLEATTS